MLELLIKNAHIVDGSGGAPFKGDVAIDQGKIAAVAPVIEVASAHSIDARGLFVTPGFIDVHRHADNAIFKTGFGAAELAQGITTIINGNCGLSAAPCGGPYRDDMLNYLEPVLGSAPPDMSFDSYSAYAAAAQRAKLPLNVGMDIGGGTARAMVLGYNTTAPRDGDMAAICAHIESALRDGAQGVSIGLEYMPESLYDTNTLLKALEPMRGADVPLAVHLRGEGDTLSDSLEEAFVVAKTLGVRLHISHLKCIGRRNWGRSEEILKRIERAREDGLEITCDVYPYTAGSTRLMQIFPPDIQIGSTERVLRNLRDNQCRAQLKRIWASRSDRFENYAEMLGWDKIILSGLTRRDNMKYTGMSIAQAARERGQDPGDCVCDLMVSERLQIAMIDHIAREDDVENILSWRDCAVISDATYPDGGMPHPRVYAAFTEVIRTYVRKKQLLSLSEAVRKMTSLPAQIYNLKGKGLIAKGMDADICLFDPDEVDTRATYEYPRRMSTGMERVLVNGATAFRDGHMTEVRAGRFLRRA